MKKYLQKNKRIKENKVYKIILYPGEIRSRHDGDRHFICGCQLRHLYGILPTDIVIEARDEKALNGYGFSQEKISREGWIELSPRDDGKYYNIHELECHQRHRGRYKVCS